MNPSCEVPRVRCALQLIGLRKHTFKLRNGTLGKGFFDHLQILASQWLKVLLSR